MISHLFIASPACRSSYQFTDMREYRWINLSHFDYDRTTSKQDFRPEQSSAVAIALVSSLHYDRVLLPTTFHGEYYVD